MQSQPRQFSPQLIWICIAIAASRVMAWITLPLYDDAFITLRYARNLFAGNGFVYNPGEWILGTTTPGFGLWVAGLYAVGLPLPESVILLNILFDILTFSLVALTFKERQSHDATRLFGILLALSPIMARVCVGGMEMSMYLSLSMLAILLYHRERTSFAIIVASLTYFFRPEGVLLVGILCLTEFLKDRRGGMKLMLTSLLSVAPFLAVMYLTYGNIVPQSVVAKSLLEKDGSFLILWQLLSPDPLLIAALPFALYGSIRAFRNGGAQRTVVLWLMVYLAAYMVGRPKIWSWYGEPIYASVLLLGSIGATALLHRVRRLNPLPEWTIWGAATMVILVWGAVLYKTGPSPVRTAVYTPMEQWSSTHLSERDTILAYDIGAIGFYSNAHIIDFAGLVTPDISRFHSYADAIRSLRPGYVFLFATEPMIGYVQRTPEFSAYEPVVRFSKHGTTALTLDSTKMKSEWLQDYILFRRKALPPLM